MEHVVRNHALSICLDEQSQAVCVAVSADSVEGSGHLLINSSAGRLDGADLVLDCGVADVRLQAIDKRIAEAFGLGLPLVVLDPVKQEENLVQISVPAAGQVGGAYE
ncbi:hypothetical protein ACYPKM_05115 [Pseudomonas aeruginosa]